jgi:hypothetical protein
MDLPSTTHPQAASQKVDWNSRRLVCLLYSPCVALYGDAGGYRMKEAFMTLDSEP